MYAISLKKEYIVRILLNFPHIDLLAKDENGKTALKHAKFIKNKTIIDLVKQKTLVQQLSTVQKQIAETQKTQNSIDHQLEAYQDLISRIEGRREECVALLKNLEQNQARDLIIKITDLVSNFKNQIETLESERGEADRRDDSDEIRLIDDELSQLRPLHDSANDVAAYIQQTVIEAHELKTLVNDLIAKLEERISGDDNLITSNKGWLKELQEQKNQSQDPETSFKEELGPVEELFKDLFNPLVESLVRRWDSNPISNSILGQIIDQLLDLIPRDGNPFRVRVLRAWLQCIYRNLFSKENRDRCLAIWKAVNRKLNDKWRSEKSLNLMQFEALCQIMLPRFADPDAEKMYGNFMGFDDQNAVMDDKECVCDEDMNESDFEIKDKIKDHNFNIIWQNESGKTLLMAIMIQSRIDFIEAIFTHPDIDSILDLKDDDGKTAFDYAEASRNQKVINLLASKLKPRTKSRDFCKKSKKR